MSKHDFRDGALRQRILKSKLPGLALRTSQTIAFSLIEVVLALAIISVILMSILGMMAYSSQLVMKADKYETLSNVSSQILAQFASQSFYVSTNIAYTNGAYYFSSDGLPTNSASAYYQCNATNVTPTNATSSLSLLTNNYRQIQVTIRWPKPQFTSTNVIVTSCLNYN